MVDSAAALDLALVAQFSKGDLDSLDTSDLMAVGVAAFNAENYPKADTAFSKTVSRNPWSRDARYNLANTYFAMKNNEKLIEQAIKLLEIEPMNEDALRLLGQGQRGLKREDDMIKTAGRLVGLPFTIEITSFQMNQATAKLVGEAIGRSPMDEAGRAIKTAPMTIEFVDAGGAVVDTREFTVPVLASAARHTIQLDAKGVGIAGWRYHVK
jgi:tetratricopeptide (TPR) repeat protein